MNYKGFLLEELYNRLQKIKDSKLYRELNVVEKRDDAIIYINGERYINFGSNDYLGISKNKEVVEEGARVLKEFGSNICSAQTLCGYSIYHRSLSDTLKKLFDVEEVLLFSSGYLANLSILQVFPKEETEVFMDIYNHRSLIDSARLAGVKLFFYRHQDFEQLKKLLSTSKAKYRIIATDTVFSMGGDTVDLPQLLQIQKDYETFLLLDDAHGFLVLRYHIFDHFKICVRTLTNFIYVATLSKSSGNLGGFALGEKVVLELVRNTAGTFLFDTALPPHICAMAQKAINIALTNPMIFENLYNNISFFNKAFNIQQKTPIFIRKYSDIERLNTVYKNLLKNGIYIPAIRPPTVPKGESRLRISLSALHTFEQLEKVIKCLNYG